jgi:hypothetical protein
MKRMKYFLAIMVVIFLLSGLVFALPTYYKFTSLNYNSITATTAWTKLVTTSGTHSFTTTTPGSVVEVHVNSNFMVGTLSGANGVMFQVRVDDLAPYYETEGVIRTSNTTEFLSIFAAFPNLATGSHTVSLWARTYSGTATSVLADPEGWNGAIIVKETMN